MQEKLVTKEKQNEKNKMNEKTMKIELREQFPTTG